MTGVLKVLLWIYGIGLILMGLCCIITPDWIFETLSLSGILNLSNNALLIGAELGIVYIAAGVWIAAAGRDPLRHLTWIKFAILKSALSIVALIYVFIQEYVDSFSSVMIPVIFDAVFMIAFLIFYPWKTKNTKSKVA